MVRLERPEVGECRRQAVRDDLVEPFWAGHVLESVLAQVDERDSTGEVTGNQVVRRLLDQDLTAVADGADPRSAMDVKADQSRGADVRLARMDAHPDPDVRSLGPRVTGQAPLRRDRRKQRTARGREGEVEAVSGRALLDATLVSKGIFEQPMVVRQGFRVALTECLEQSGGAFDVGEEERDGPDRGAAHG
jgi:hypothetical protein